MRKTLSTALTLILVAGRATAAPDYTQSVLETVYPAGAQQGTTVDVVFEGPKGSLAGATEVIVDGPPGVRVEVVEANERGVRAKLTVAKDAAPGRRMLRVKGGVTGLTNFRWFFVGTLPEHVEEARNDEPGQAEAIETPVVVNGRVEATLDRDCFRFEANEGQKLVLAVQSHWLDAMGYGRNEAGFSDTSLELLDESGRVVAEAGDTLGYDPLIHYVVPESGTYTARVSGMGYRGFPQMVYRLTIGEVPYPTAVFPPGGRRGESVEVEFFGPNVPPGTRRTIRVDDAPSPVQYVALDGELAGAPGLPFVRSDVDEASAVESGEGHEDAALLETLPVIVNGRFDEPGDADWFRLEMKQGEAVELDVLAQRHLRSPVDTLLEVYDADGERLAANDDGEILAGEVTHEFVPFDSHLTFTAKQAGTYFVRVAEQSGAAGPRAVYRLSVRRNTPDFALYQWPDAVPVWGPGTTAGFVVEIHRFGGLKTDVELTVEGLPEGWTGSTVTAFESDYKPPRNAFGHKQFLTITAPDDAEPGATVPFRVVGRTTAEGGELVRTAQPLTHYSWGQPNRFRVSPIARAVVARPRGTAFTATLRSVTVKPGGQVEIPLQRLGDAQPDEPLRVSVNQAKTHFKCAVGAPLKVALEGGAGTASFTLPAKYQSGRSYFFVLADAWASETRKGLPGPCTRLVRVDVE